MTPSEYSKKKFNSNNTSENASFGKNKKSNSFFPNKLS